MEEREGRVCTRGNDPIFVTIIDNGEDFEDGIGKNPNHDKIEIEYPVDK